MRPLIAERTRGIPTSGIREIFEKAQTMSDVIRLEVGEPDFNTPDHITAAAARALSEGETHYTSTAGVFELREQISQKFRRENDLEFDPKTQIMVTSGAVNGLTLSLMATVNPGDEVLIPDPGWPNYVGCIKIAQGVPIQYSLLERNRFGPDLNEIRAKINKKTKAILICSPNNPTGSVLTDKDLREIAAIAEQNDLLVISDEVYEKITYGSIKHQSIGALSGMDKRVLTVNAFSKTYAMTGWRLGYVGGPAEVISQMIKINMTLNTCANSIAQKAGVEALRGPQDCVRRMREEYSRRRDFILGRLSRIPDIACVPPEGAFYVFPNIRGCGLSSHDFSLALLDQARVSTVPGTAFGEFGEGYIRLSFANSIENIGRAMDRIEKALNSGMKNEVS